VAVVILLQSSRYGVRGVSSGINIVNKCENKCGTNAVKMRRNTFFHILRRNALFHIFLHIFTYCGRKHMFFIYFHNCFYTFLSHIAAERIFSHIFQFVSTIVHNLPHSFTCIFPHVFHPLWRNTFFPHMFSNFPHLSTL
jgi:hypothetical protein